MNEAAYLERMRSIREKYGCQKSYQSLPKHSEFLYPLSQATQPHPQTPSPHDSFSTHSPFHREQLHIDLSAERPKRDYVVPERRFASVERHQSPLQRQSPRKLVRESNFLSARQMSQAQLKRQDNFNQFIDDLDKRISEKEKLLNEKFRENEMILRKVEGIQPETANNYSTRAQRRQQTQSGYQQYSERTPTKAYEKSKSIKSKFDRVIDNAENEVSTKLQWTRSPAQSKPRNYNFGKEGQLASSPSIDMVSRKLEGSSMRFGHDGWNPQKLETIQQRIQSVLKQSNR